MVDEMVASHSVDKGDPGMHLCGGQIHVQLWIGWQASSKLPSLIRLAFPSSCCWVNCPPSLQQLMNRIVYAVLRFFLGYELFCFGLSMVSVRSFKDERDERSGDVF